jgi:hypothetical protein
MPAPLNPARLLTLSFQRLANLDCAIFERLGRYEATLARQTLRTIFLLRSARDKSEAENARDSSRRLD